MARRKPRYEVKVWNKYHTGTNNRSENWNSVPNLGMNINLTIWTVMELFMKEEAFAKSKMHSLALGTLTIDHPTRKKKQIERRNKLMGIMAK